MMVVELIGEKDMKVSIQSKTQESGFILVGLCLWDNVKDINILFQVCRGNLRLIYTCNVPYFISQFRQNLISKVQQPP